MEKLFEFQVSDFEKGRIVDRLNRFVLLVDFGTGKEKVYLANPGALSTVLTPKGEILCRHVEKNDRKTEYDAFAIKVDDFFVTVRSTFANDVFSKVVEGGYLDSFQGYTVVSKEPSLPDHGRADFLLEEDGRQAFVEVKSCTHVENGTAKFPDRPTERGRRHLRALKSLVEEGIESHMVFVVQRKDAKNFRPFREVDPEFADLLSSAAKAGVNLQAISIDFDPPYVYLMDHDLPIGLE